MSIFGIFNIGKTGLLTHQRAINTTSNNIANVDTPGYTRQRVVMAPIPPTSSAAVPMGGGVEVTEIERIADRFLDAQLQREQQRLAYHEGMEFGLGQIEGVFSDLEGNGIQSALSRFFASFNDLSANPGDLTARSAVSESGQTLAQLIRTSDRQLGQLQLDANGRVQQLASEVSAIAGDLAELNQQIFSTEVGSASAASALRDQRNQLMEKLGEKIDFTSFERTDGQISVFVAGGFLLVDSGTAATLSVEARAGTPGYFDVFHNLDGTRAGPVTSLITGGQLGAQIELRDTTLQNKRDQLDEMAYSLLDRVNTQHRAGLGLVDGTARDFFTDISGSLGVDPSNPIRGAAGLLSVDAAIVSNVRHIAAGTTPVSVGGPAGSGDNTNAAALAGLETTASAMFQITDPIAGPASGASATVSDFYASMLGDLGAQLGSSRRNVTQSEVLAASLEERRSAISGVSIDEEVTDLVRFQRGYEASARIIRTVDEMLQTLLEL